MYLFTEF